MTAGPVSYTHLDVYKRQALADAGVDAVTVSLDTLDPEMYRRLTRRGELETVLRGLTLAMRENRIPLKINCVSVYGVREQELLKGAALARDNAVHVRFIEMMPCLLYTSRCV